MMKKVAIIGTQGIPARYGGFETMVENITGANCSPDVSYTVFCSAVDMPERLPSHNGATLKYVRGFRANGAQSALYDISSMLRCIGKGYDAVLVLGVSGCLFLPLFRLLFRGRIIVNIDGLEHRRAKWGRFAKWFLRVSEACAVRFSHVVVADNAGIRDYVRETYGRDAELIAYGGDQVLRNMSDAEKKRIVEGYGLHEGCYTLSVCRIEPENSCHIVLEAFSSLQQHSRYETMVFVGNWDISEYGRNLKLRYSKVPGILLLDPVYDLDTLYALHDLAGLYIHGHTAGGTNPSLVEAMHFRVPVAAFDCVYNRATTGGDALFFNNILSLSSILSKDDDYSELAERSINRARSQYVWSAIARAYESLY